MLNIVNKGKNFFVKEFYKLKNRYNLLDYKFAQILRAFQTVIQDKQNKKVRLL
jgi:hypothetical protein